MSGMYSHWKDSDMGVRTFDTQKNVLTPKKTQSYFWVQSFLRRKFQEAAHPSPS